MRRAVPRQLIRVSSALLVAPLAASELSCGARTGLWLSEASVDAGAGAAGAPNPPPQTCPPAQPACLTANDNPCATPTVVPPICDLTTFTWHCAPNTWPYQSVARPLASCLPLHDPSSSLRSLGGSLPRIPTDDGRCLWIAEDVQLTTGEALQDVAFELDLRVPIGTCPATAKFLGGVPTPSVVYADGSTNPTLRVQITGSFRTQGATHVTYRLFRIDAGATFGLTELGTGLGRWDSKLERIVVPAPSDLRFNTQLDSGNASFVDGDYTYLWGCNAPGQFLSRGCLLARLDQNDALAVLENDGQWVVNGGTDGARIVFDDGPWITSVLRDPRNANNLLHVFAPDFSSDLRLQSAALPEGPWTNAASLGPCHLPKDPKSYCAGPIVHEELADPKRPTEWSISYGVGTTDPNSGGTVEDYWSRLDLITTH